MDLTLKYAIQYAKLGWHVFPCVPRGKEPLGKLVPRGVKDATTNEGIIKDWWTKQPNANIAVACGVISGIHVADVDFDEALGKDGWKTLRSLANAGSPMPETIRQDTPRGGAHFFFRTDDPPVNHNSKGPDDPFAPDIDIRSNGYYVILAPSIHPNGGQYIWAKGLSPWDRQAAEWPNFLRPLPKPVQSPQAAVWTPQEPGCSASEVNRRASAYLATCDPAIEGMGGHDKLLWAAVCLVHGFLLPNDVALNLLAQEYNPRCIPPWDFSIPADVKDFRRKVHEARKLIPAKQPGWLLLDGDFILPTEGIAPTQLKAFIQNSLQTHNQEATSILPARENHADLMRLDPDWQFVTRPTGFLGELCSWINGTALMDQPLLNLGCALAFLGCLFGRKIKTPGGLRSNLYCMGIGGTSSGKNHARSLIRKLCVHACCQELLGGDDFASDSSIEKCLSKQPSIIFLLDEVGHLLSYAKHGDNAHLHKIVPFLMKLYSAAGDIYKGREYAEDDKQRILTQPCCCIWGSTTPREFSSGLSMRDLESGWLSRCLVFRTDSIPEKTRNLTEAIVPDALADLTAQWFFRKIEKDGEKTLSTFIPHQRLGNNVVAPPEQIVVAIPNAAQEVFYALDKHARIESEAAGDFGPMWLKAEENARKVALIVAAGESFGEPIITPAVADYACRLITFLLRDFNHFTGRNIYDSAFDMKKRKVLMAIEQRGEEGCTKRQLTRSTQRLFNQNERSAFVNDLIEAGEVYATLADRSVIYRTEKYQLLVNQAL